VSKQDSENDSLLAWPEQSQGIYAKPAFVVPLLAAALSLAVPKLALRLCTQAAAGRRSGAAKKV
jgi:hypothetical protein